MLATGSAERASLSAIGPACRPIGGRRRRQRVRAARRKLVRKPAAGVARVTLDEIRALGLRLAELCQKYGIAELSVFGSVARGEARPDSDVDLLYVRIPGNDLGMSYFALQDDLEQLFGRPVDLVPKEGLHRVIRNQVLADAQVLYTVPRRPGIKPG
jgi:predicted nucleotidyltransferase